MWSKYVFLMFTFFPVNGTTLKKDMVFENKNKISFSDGSNTNASLTNKVKQIIEVSINGTGVNYNNIMYDNGYFSLTVNITSKYTIYGSVLVALRPHGQNKTGLFDKLVTAGNQTVTESIDYARIRMTNCCVINNWDNFTARAQEQHSPGSSVNNRIIGAIVDGTSRKAGSKALTRAASSPPRDGSLSETQHDRYVEIIKAVKCSLNVVALLMTLMSVVAFSRTKHFNSTTTFIIALNIFGFIAALLSLVGYAMSFSLGTASQAYLIYTQFMNMYAGAVCRRIAHAMWFGFSSGLLCQHVVTFLVKARRKFRNSTNIVIIVAVVVVTFGTHAYVPVCYIVVPQGGDKFRLGYSPLYKRNTDRFGTASSATKFLFAFLPLMASLLANIFLLAYLKHHARTTKSLRVAPKADEAFSRQNRQVTLIVLVSSVSFTLLSFPANIHLLITSYTTQYGYHQNDHYLFMVVHESLLGLLTLGDIANFLSYLFLSSAFRSQFRLAFKPPALPRFQRPALTGKQTAATSSACAVHTVSGHLGAAPVSSAYDVHTVTGHLGAAPASPACAVNTVTGHLEDAEASSAYAVHTVTGHLGAAPASSTSAVHTVTGHLGDVEASSTCAVHAVPGHLEAAQA